MEKCPNCGAYMRLIWSEYSPGPPCPHCGRKSKVLGPERGIVAYWRCDRCRASVYEGAELNTLRRMQLAEEKL